VPSVVNEQLSVLSCRSSVRNRCKSALILRLRSGRRLRMERRISSPIARRSQNPYKSVPSGLEIFGALHYRATRKVGGLKDRPPAGCTQWQ